jgi:ArsR family metal-binding transcriptional regulator
MSGHLLRPCKSTAAFEAIPKPVSGKINLDLPSCQRTLTSLGYHEVCDAVVMIILKKEIEVTIYPNGKLILKTDSKEQAKQTMDEIYSIILDD